ncbi:hypothetical protein [Anaerococcus sp. Marseille-Q5996]|uniref:hypothetical protein n=1 Tax=Anaerococcus sp. Marseille-Q5996 TaxID=2972769 RepID=UPI0021C68418|nr:hypothetical protein [Anaerococcus sp. Marseille-Q5996]
MIKYKNKYPIDALYKNKQHTKIYYGEQLIWKKPPEDGSFTVETRGSQYLYSVHTKPGLRYRAFFKYARSSLIGTRPRYEDIYRDRPPREGVVFTAKTSITHITTGTDNELLRVVREV